MLRLLPPSLYLTAFCSKRSHISTSALEHRTKTGRGSRSQKVYEDRKQFIDNKFDLDTYLSNLSKDRREMYSDFDWSDVYPAEKPFDPYLINLPVRAGGHNIKRELAPFSENNVVFWDSPNFFHLTPSAIKKHCAALRPLCTPWPSDLPYCPVEVETVDFLLPGNDRYHPDARKVVMEIDFDSLKLSGRPREKMLELLAGKYDVDRNVVKLQSERCPTKTQNRDYLFYLLKVLFYEANRSEEWEEMRLLTNSNQTT